MDLYRELAGCMFFQNNPVLGTETWYPCNKLQAALWGAWPLMRKFSSAMGNSSWEGLGHDLCGANMASSCGFEGKNWVVLLELLLQSMSCTTLIFLLCIIISGKGSSGFWLLSFLGKCKKVSKMTYNTCHWQLVLRLKLILNIFSLQF